ncbi:MAG: hypothetical protein COX48_04770 [bacterium (Candidatus Stahlbacteria) CG23_combo_of_CG06-09_8_20_14_all_34_7]|nr:MAG: hypothetical protein COX48_04770 [bacterium (Candidatus Stahlbacteria) CG23_combo_of_CG06-09_8_20_14_all_34_7]
MLKKMLYLFAVIVMFTNYTFAEDDAVSNTELTGQVSQVEEQFEKENVLPEDKINNISISGLIELEANYEKMDSNDISLATAMLNIDAEVIKYIKGHITFLYEDGEDLLLDEGYILMDGENILPLHLKAGEICVPFGKFESSMISDPLTLEMGEMHETAVELGTQYFGFYSSIYAFNGDIDKSGNNRIDNYGASIGYVIEKELYGLDVGVDWINNIIDSDKYSDIIAEKIEEYNTNNIGLELRDYVPGFCAHAIFSLGPVTLIGEYISMLKEPEWNIITDLFLDSIIKDKKIVTWNFELGYTFSPLGKETTFAAAIQGSENGDKYFPKERYIGSIGVNICEGVTLSLEYHRDEYETVDNVDVLTTQLAIEF